MCRTSLISVSLLYHRGDRKEKNQHTQFFVLCDIEENTSVVGIKEVILETQHGAFTSWSGSLRSGVYVVIPFSTSFWAANNSKRDERSRNYTLVVHSSTQIDGVLLKEPPTLLADCLIAATIKLCPNPNIVCFSHISSKSFIVFISLFFLLESFVCHLYDTTKFRRQLGCR